MIQEQFSIVANTWIKHIHFGETGDVMPGHVHTFDHQTLLATGSVQVELDDVLRETVYQAPRILVISKGKRHTFRALEPNTTLYCVHALRKSNAVDDVFDPEDKPTLDQAYPLTIEE